MIPHRRGYMALNDKNIKLSVQATHLKTVWEQLFRKGGAWNKNETFSSSNANIYICYRILQE